MKLIFFCYEKKNSSKLITDKVAHTHEIKIFLSKLKATLKEPPHNLTHIFSYHKKNIQNGGSNVLSSYLMDRLFVWICGSLDKTPNYWYAYPEFKYASNLFLIKCNKYYTKTIHNCYLIVFSSVQFKSIHMEKIYL